MIPLYVACQKGHHDVVQTLLGAGADVNISRYDVSPLWTATYNGHLEVVKTLIEAGANVNQANKVLYMFLLSVFPLPPSLHPSLPLLLTLR